MATRIPATVLGREVPEEFRRRRGIFEDAGAVLSDFVGWLETSCAAGVGSPHRAESSGQAVSVGSPGGAESPGQAVSERARLVALCADLYDRLSSEGVRDKLRHGLGEVGVELVHAHGETFEPQLHEAAGQVPTPDPALHDRVASTQRVGWSDRGSTGREPVVLVYCFGGADGQG